MEIIKTESGEVHFKLPNLIETPRFLGKLGVSSKMDSSNEFELYAKVLENMGLFIKKIDVVYEGRKIEKYEELWDIKEWQKPFYEMANKILGAMNNDFDDKKKQD